MYLNKWTVDRQLGITVFATSHKSWELNLNFYGWSLRISDKQVTLWQGYHFRIWWFAKSFHVTSMRKYGIDLTPVAELNRRAKLTFEKQNPGLSFGYVPTDDLGGSR